MYRDAEPLRFYDFNEIEFLADLKQVQQVEYLRKYLSSSQINAQKLIEEPYYFDRDYLSEFAHFYSTSTRAYSNACRRIHIFDSTKIDEKLFNSSLAGNKKALSLLQNSYLGFIVIRPLEHAPLGRTVLKWYPDDKLNQKRVTKTSRKYKVHLAGIQLSIEGLAWQQQDDGVSACATIALWTLLHSSALDDYHQIPTTAEITVAAHTNYSEGRHPFPSAGLTSNQICDSIIHYGLRPASFAGDAYESEDTNYDPAFTTRLFGHIVGSFLRSGYPVLLFGKQYEKIGKGKPKSFDHSICIVAFRENVGASQSTDNLTHYDENITHVYAHDDNLGPNVRFEIQSDNEDRAILVPSAPSDENKPELFKRFIKFIPIKVIVAVNKELRVTPERLYDKAYKIAYAFQNIWENELGGKEKVSFGMQYFRITDFFSEELPNLLGKKKGRLSKIRRAIIDTVPPLSLHIGVIRIGIGEFRILDILCDTSQTDPIPYATICYHSQFKKVITSIDMSIDENLSELVLELYLDS